MNDLACWSGLHAGDPVSMPATSKAQAPNPGQQQAESAAAPVKGPAQAQGKKKNWFQKYVWDYSKGK